VDSENKTFMFLENDFFEKFLRPVRSLDMGYAVSATGVCVLR
jgi:hypothetical protein